MSNNYRNFKFDQNNHYLIMVTIETYNRTESGKNWKNKPDKIQQQIYKDKNYTNYISSIPFFNNFGYGSYCRGYKSYTAAGYLVTRVISVNPGSSVKKVAYFRFISKDILKLNAGYRENDIIDNARTWEKFPTDNKHDCISFITADNKSCTFDFKTNNYVN